MMNATAHALELDGWSTTVVVTKTCTGRYSGTAALNLEGSIWGTLVFMDQPTLEASLERVKLRVAQFARQRRLPS